MYNLFRKALLMPLKCLENFFKLFVIVSWRIIEFYKNKKKVGELISNQHLKFVFSLITQV